MDEIDSIGSARMESGSGNGDSEVQRTMLELLNQLDGFEASNKIKVLITMQKGCLTGLSYGRFNFVEFSLQSFSHLLRPFFCFNATRF